MLFFSLLITFSSLYMFTFFYYFSFNENFLLIFFFAFFLYVIYSKLLSSLMHALDSNSLELYLNFKQQVANVLSKLSIVRSRVSLFTDTSENVFNTLENFLNFQLNFLSFVNNYNELLVNQIFSSNLDSAIQLQNSFIKSELGSLVKSDSNAVEFES